MLQVYVSGVLDVSEVCCKCFRCVAKIDLNVEKVVHVLQASVPNVSSVFLDIHYKCIYFDVAYVSHICCKCFI
jgi:hypothetical protein